MSPPARSRASLFASALVLGSLFAGLLPAACTTKEPTQSTYFDRSIEPIFQNTCVRTSTGAGCHTADAKGNALGNLDLSSFDGMNHRRDLLANYGPYGQPSLLVKTVKAPIALTLQSYDGTQIPITTDIKHGGLNIIDATSSDFRVLSLYMKNGATENNTGLSTTPIVRQPCSPTVPTVAGFDPTTDPTASDYAEFKNNVNPIIGSTCSASNCHGTSVNELYLTCGATDAQTRWNYYIASQYVTVPADQSEIVRRPLAPSAGGSFHEGGTIFTSASDPGYTAFLNWATDHGAPVFPASSIGFSFFVNKVQPMLVKKGCMMLQCHSAAMFHDYRLRGGSGGSFSYDGTQKNYELTLAQMSLESDDINSSRLVQKNLKGGGPGYTASQLAHRGGPLFEDDFGDAGASPAACDAMPYDYDNGMLDQIPAYCIFREWLKREQTDRKLAPMSAIAYVKRTAAPAPDRAQDFDVYAGGSDLHVMAATIAAGVVTPGVDTSVTSGCGLDATTADIRRPAVSWDGKKIAFAARSSAAEGLAIYEMNADGTSCAKHPLNTMALPANANNLTVHNFDPAYSPPDTNGVMHLVFASTRGNIDPSPSPYDYDGPQRTPADPTKLNSNLYVYEPTADGASTQIRQLTFLLNMERYPSFMSDGRVIFTTEKREPGFYELALRRINLDGGDYHPLYSQRGSIGYAQATNVVELSNKSFLTVFSDQGAPHSGGTLGLFNRSIGVDFTSTNAADYPIDPTVIDPTSTSSPEAAFFIHSLKFPDPAASGHLMTSTAGIYATPAALPATSEALVSYSAATDLGSFDGNYDLYVYNVDTGAKTMLVAGGGSSIVDAVAVYERFNKGIFQSALDEPNGHTTIMSGHAEADITVLDMPVLASLLFQNTPTGRLVDRDLKSIDVYEELPPTSDVTSYAAGGSNVVKDSFGQVYVRRRLLGNVPISSDGSLHMTIPGGLPIVLHLPDTSTSTSEMLPRFQREEMEFAPGEYANQSMPANFFDGLCAGCHGSISGRPLDFSVQPDLLTQASQVVARGTTPFNLNLPPAMRGAIVGPPASP